MIYIINAPMRIGNKQLSPGCVFLADLADVPDRYRRGPIDGIPKTSACARSHFSGTAADR